MIEFVYVAEAFEWWLVGMAVRLGGYQPHYFPRLHCIARMLDSDISPIADYVQYVRKHAYPGPNGTRVNGPSYQAQTPIKTSTGVLLLGVPVAHAGKRQRINEARISYETPWQEKHLNIIEQNYRTAPHFSEVFPQLREILMRRYETLADLSVASLTWSLTTLFGTGARASLEDVRTALPYEGARLRNLLLVSKTPVAPPDKDAGRDANEWIIDMCRHFGADEYYFGGTSATCYMDFKRFEDAGIALKQQAWQCGAYPQQHGGFTPNLSILDLLMNADTARARTILHTPAA